MTLQQWARDGLSEAIGHRHRHDPVLPGNGGPAGNARLTAWTGALLLVLFLVELATLLNVTGLISWHIVVGILLVPPALVKTASTGWRIMRYYAHNEAYRAAGPPSMPLRVLGPLVVLFTLAVLGSGLALLALGPVASLTPFMSVLGFQISALTVHQGTFIVWAVVAGLHTLGRLVPALRIITGERDGVPGRMPRVALLCLVLAVAGLAAGLLYGTSSSWQAAGALHHHHHFVPGVSSNH